MAQILTNPKFRVTDANGNALASGKVYFYETGTTTPKATYSDAGLSSANANPVVLDSRGEAWVFAPDGAVYTILVKTSADVTVWTKDVITFDPAKTTVAVGAAAKLAYGSGYVRIEEGGNTNLLGLEASQILLSSGIKIVICTGTPEGAVTAPVGSLALRTDGGASTTLYVKTSGTGNTGWTAK